MIEGTRAVVTGGSGFIGRHLRRGLADAGVDVHTVSRSRGNGEDSWHEADVTDSSENRRMLHELLPDVVYHLSSRVTASHALTDVQSTFNANVASTVALLSAAAEVGCQRVVLVGSDKELGIRGGFPGSPYAASKLAATTYAQMFHAVYGLSIVNLRLFMVYGPDQPDRSKLVPYTISSMLTGKSPRLSAGVRCFDWVYVEDVVEALLAASLAADGDDGRPIDVGTGILTSTREVVEEIGRIVGNEVMPSYGMLSDRLPEPQFAANLASASSVLGWRPRTSLSEGLEATVVWHRELLDRMLEGA